MSRSRFTTSVEGPLQLAQPRAQLGLLTQAAVDLKHATSRGDPGARRRVVGVAAERNGWSTNSSNCECRSWPSPTLMDMVLALHGAEPTTPRAAHRVRPRCGSQDARHEASIAAVERLVADRTS
jgi:hypothetical protein